MVKCHQDKGLASRIFRQNLTIERAFFFFTKLAHAHGEGGADFFSSLILGTHLQNIYFPDQAYLLIITIYVNIIISSMRIIIMFIIINVKMFIMKKTEYQI